MLAAVLNALFYVLLVPLMVSLPIAGLLGWRVVVEKKDAFLERVVFAGIVAPAALAMAAVGFWVRALSRGSTGSQTAGLAVAVAALLASMGPQRTSIWTAQYRLLTTPATA